MLFEIGNTKNVTVGGVLRMVANGDISGCLGPVHFCHQQLAAVAAELNRLLSNFSLSGPKDELVWSVILKYYRLFIAMKKSCIFV